MPDFADLPLLANVAIFAAGAAVVWFAGTKLSVYVDRIADRTGLGKAFAGGVFLAAATSLPEVATTLTASYSGAAKLAGTNLLGGIAMQIAVLAVVDALAVRGKPLTLFSPNASMLTMGTTLMGLVALASGAIVGGELFSFAGIGVWPVVLFAAYAVSMWAVYRQEGDPRWEPRGEVAQSPKRAQELQNAQREKYAGTSKAALFGLFAAASLATLCGGFFVARTGEALAEQTGLGQNFVGATIVALATSLPEVSTTWSAVRFGAYSLAIANILGTNSLSIALFLPAELAYREGPVVDALDPSAAFLGTLGVVTTALYLWGLLERRDKTILGMGYDSFAVLIVYLGGLAIYYTL